MVNVEELLQRFPTKRIKPVDGMIVTAKVWQDAHDFHRQSQGALTVLGHGTGIITGLEVIASDPPDTSVYILPGVAVDPLGQIIVLPQPTAYDIGHEMEGRLYLLLSYGESRPQIDREEESQAGAPLYVNTTFSIFARTALPDTPCVELARVNRSSRDAVFTNAQNPAWPELDEIDLRFRWQVGAPKPAGIAVCYLGEAGDRKQGQGVMFLAQALNGMSHCRVSVTDNASLAPGVERNALIYLVGQGKFELSSGQINGLSNYVRKGKGTLFMESNDEASQTAFLDLLASIDLKLMPLESNHRLLMYPHLFAALPQGFETGQIAKVLVAEGVILSTCNYGRLWRGEVQAGVASREQIRSAIEWGSNIIAYALDRRCR